MYIRRKSAVSEPFAVSLATPAVVLLSVVWNGSTVLAGVAAATRPMIVIEPPPSASSWSAVNVTVVGPLTGRPKLGVAELESTLSSVMLAGICSEIAVPSATLWPLLT